MRCDPSIATGFSPGELLLGRPLVFPLEINAADIDLTGAELTTPLVLKLKEIRKNNFSLAHKNIQKSQERYKRKYDRKNQAKKFNFKAGDRVQYKKYKSKRVLSKQNSSWVPVVGYYVILTVVKKTKTVVLETTEGKVLKKRQPFDRIRKYQGP